MPKNTGEITADASLAQWKKSAPQFTRLMAGMREDMAGMASVREADHNGHHIVVKTTYTITIDGKRFKGMLGVTNGGAVHYHGMPNVGFASAIDLVKAVIDQFPGEFEKGTGDKEGRHEGHGMTMPMSGMTMKMPGMTRKRKAKKRSRKRG